MPLPTASDDYDLPPLPPLPAGATPEQAHHQQLLEWQTRALDGRLRHGAAKDSAERAQVCERLEAVESKLGEVLVEVREDERPPPQGPVSRLMTWASALPLPVQLALASTLGPTLAAILYQASGAAIEHLTGRPPPQATVPVEVRSDASLAMPATTPPVVTPPSAADSYGDIVRPE